MKSTEYIDFRQYLLAIQRRWLPATAIFTCVVGLALLNVFLQKPVYEAKGKILIKKSSNVTSAITQGEEIGGLSSVGSQSDPLITEIELIRSTPVARKTISTLNLNIKPQAFLDDLKILRIGKTDILEISYQNSDPKVAALAVNEVVNFYLANNVVDNRSEAATARRFIVKQLPKTEAIVRQAEELLRRFEEQNSIVDLEGEAKSAVSEIANLESQLSTAQVQLADTTTQSQTLQNDLLGMGSQQAIVASSVSQSPGVQKAVEELQQVESQLATGLTIYQETHPKIIDLQSKKASLESLLQGRVEQVIGAPTNAVSQDLQVGQLKQQLTTNLVQLETQRLGLESQVSALSNLLASYKQRANVLPGLKQRKGELEREVKAAQSTYETLLRRLEEIRVEENRVVGNARLIEVAEVPEKPVGANEERTIALGVLLGILLGVGTALILDALDTSIKTVKEAREVFGGTLLGLIPFFGKKDLDQDIPIIVARDLPRSSISEAYRTFQANLNFLSSDKELKVVVVTSSIPQEGKSTLCANLAVTMAQSERRVLLIDADTRQPSQHKIWNLVNQVGLSNVLVNKADLKTAIKKVMPNLSVLPAGAIPPNPMPLLESKRMTSLIDHFSDSYDFVIIDTPALNIGADAAILGKIADGILLVVRPGVVNSASATTAKEFLEHSGQNVLGLVINGMSSDNNHYSSYTVKDYYNGEDLKLSKTLALNSRKNLGNS
ncbi:GumC family protein [Synechocystis sp. PCC 7509]|uniref:GumC family protein n=1 Tax=Synechocystis sp. PCC 7509 TaxID=927677 RepID=UPI0002AC20D3|nr:polysaccharide biosynthesis tyrosine autokinase [Synechocystis sp. PCC 7509]